MAKIYNYFSNYINDEDLAYIGSGEITRFTVYKSDRRLELDILMDKLLDYQVVSRCRTALKNALDLNEAVINIKYFKSLFDIDNIEKILSFVVADNPVVNGPGEAKEADIGVAGGDGCGLIFKKGEILRKVPEESLLDELMKEIEKL